MADEVDRIAEKYGLKLHTTSYDLHEHPELLEPCGDFLGGIGSYDHYMYEDGTFQVEGTVDLPDVGAWDFLFLRSVRGTFHDSMLAVGNVSDYREWRYETACGVAVNLALGPDQSLILAALPDCFVTVSIPGGVELGILQRHLEALADRIDFTALSPVVAPGASLETPSEVPLETLPETFSETASEEPPEAPSEAPESVGSARSSGRDTEARRVYAAVLRNLMYSGILPDGSTVDSVLARAGRFTVGDVDGDGREELVLLYDSGVTAGNNGYIIGYDADTGEIYIQLEGFPDFEFLENGNLKALHSHNQTAGELWPYSLYRYLPESDAYELAGTVYTADKSIMQANRREEDYPDEADVSGTGTVYYVSPDSWGTTPVDEADYLAWLSANGGDSDVQIFSYLSLKEEDILSIE